MLYASDKNTRMAFSFANIQYRVKYEASRGIRLHAHPGSPTGGRDGWRAAVPRGMCRAPGGPRAGRGSATTEYLCSELGESVFKNSLRFFFCGPAEQLFKIEKPVSVSPRDNHTPPPSHGSKCVHSSGEKLVNPREKKKGGNPAITKRGYHLPMRPNCRVRKWRPISRAGVIQSSSVSGDTNYLRGRFGEYQGKATVSSGRPDQYKDQGKYIRPTWGGQEGMPPSCGSPNYRKYMVWSHFVHSVTLYTLQLPHRGWPMWLAFSPWVSLTSINTELTPESFGNWSSEQRRWYWGHG